MVYHELRYPLAGQAGRPAQYHDVGGGGILFQADDDLPVGSVLHLEIKLAGWLRHHPQARGEELASYEHPMIVVGEVVRALPLADGGPYEIAVQFTSVYRDDFEALVRFIEDESARLHEDS